MKTDRKLISSRSYGKTLDKETDRNYRIKRDNYDSLLTLQLELGQFVECDLEGNVLSEPVRSDFKTGNDYAFSMGSYQRQKDRVVFEGFTFKSMGGDQGKHYLIQIQEHVFSFKDGIITFLGFHHDHIEPLTSLGLVLTPQAVETYKI